MSRGLLFLEMDLQITTIIILFSGFLASSLNIFLLCLIFFVKSKMIGQYRYLLFFYTLCGLIYSICQILSAPSFFATTSGHIFHDTIRLLPPDLSTINIFIIVGCYTQNKIILCLSFFYRYLVLCRSDDLEKFHKNWWKIVGGSLLIWAYITSLLIITTHPSSSCEDEFGLRYFETFGMKINETGYNCYPVYLKGYFNWWLFLMLGSYLFFFFIGGIIVGYCGKRVVRVLREGANHSQIVMKIQKKIFILLILQMIMPLLFNIAPIQIVMAPALFNLHVERPIIYLACALSIAQVVDPLLTVYFIKPYRLALLKLFSSFATVPLTSSSNR